MPGLAVKAFGYAVAPDLAAALTAIEDPDTLVIAGGTELVNWLKEGIVTPARLIDISKLPLGGVEVRPDGLRLGALARMSDVVPVVASDYPVLAESLLCAASPQLRNMASLGGNLMQRTRCPYFRAEVILACNKRAAGSGCAARHGENRTHAIFGWSDACVATHPSDFAVALAALDATIRIVGFRGERTVPVTGFYRLPGDDPTIETVLGPDELIIAIEVPAGPHTRASHYLKVQERASYEFAMVSVAAAVIRDGDVVTDARLALGGVAARPCASATPKPPCTACRWPTRHGYARHWRRPLPMPGRWTAMLSRSNWRSAPWCEPWVGSGRARADYRDCGASGTVPAGWSGQAHRHRRLHGRHRDRGRRVCRAGASHHAVRADCAYRHCCGRRRARGARRAYPR